MRHLFLCSVCINSRFLSCVYFTKLNLLFTYLLHGAEKVTSLQLIKKFPAFYGNRRFITAFTSARHLYLSWASLIQSIPHFLKIHLNIILPSAPGSPQWSLSLRFPHQNPVTPLPICATSPAHLILDFYPSNNVGWEVQIIKFLIMWIKYIIHGNCVIILYWINSTYWTLLNCHTWDLPC